MPKFVAWLLTLLITLAYGVLVASSPSGAMVYRHDCAEPVRVGCAGGHVETFLSHGHDGQSPCEDTQGCQVEQSGEQTLPMQVQAPRLMPVLVAVLELKQWECAAPMQARAEATGEAWTGDLAALRSTCLLI
jgi:hypothetical protein